MNWFKCYRERRAARKAEKILDETSWQFYKTFSQNNGQHYFATYINHRLKRAYYVGMGDRADVDYESLKRDRLVQL